MAVPVKKYPERVYTQLRKETFEKLEEMREERGQARAAFIRRCIQEFVQKNYEEDQLALIEETS